MDIKHKLHFILLVVLTLVMSGISIACDYTESATPAPTSPPSQLENHPEGSSESQQYPVATDEDTDEWNTVVSLTGVDDETTSDFFIAGEEWRITWMIETELPQHSVFNIYVYQKDKSTPVEIVTSSIGELTNSINFQEGGNSYYLKIITANLKSWTVVVEDYGEEPDKSPVQIVEIHYKGTVFTTESEKGICFERIEPDEYVVVKNVSEEWVDVRGWKLVNISREGNYWFIFPGYFNCCPDFFKQYFGSDFNCVPPMQCILAPHQSVLVYTDEFHPESGGLSFYHGSGEIWENNKSNTAVLYDGEGKEVSRNSYLIRPEIGLPPPIQITRINYKGEIGLPSVDTASEAKIDAHEYVEITNLSDSFQDMGGWVLKNATKGDAVFIFPINFSLGPEETVLIFTNQVQNPEDFSFYYSPGDLWDDEKPDTAVLINIMGEEVSRKSYKIMQ
jgi:hypothetical protein